MLDPDKVMLHEAMKSEARRSDQIPMSKVWTRFFFRPFLHMKRLPKTIYQICLKIIFVLNS
jgi:hypothetical protein